MDHATLTIRQPEWDDGGLSWSDELEGLYQKANENGRAAVLLPEGDGFLPVILLGWRIKTEHRAWIVRMSLVLSATDFPARFAINCQFQGEPAGQQMYPRLPFEWRKTGDAAALGHPAEAEAMVAVLVTSERPRTPEAPPCVIPADRTSCVQ